LNAAIEVLLAWAVTCLGLALYGFAGCGGVLGDGLTVGHLQISLESLFPALIFSEFNFLTFMFVVAPLTAVVAPVIVVVSLELGFLKVESESGNP
jgi:hypothetical protein